LVDSLLVLLIEGDAAVEGNVGAGLCGTGEMEFLIAKSNLGWKNPEMNSKSVEPLGTLPISDVTARSLALFETKTGITALAKEGDSAAKMASTNETNLRPT